MDGITSSLVVTASQIANNPSGVYFSLSSTGHHETRLMSRRVPPLCEVQRLEQGFSTSALTVCVGQVTCLVHCRMLSPIPDPYPGHGIGTPSLPPIPSKLWQLNVSRYSQMFLGEQNYFSTASLRNTILDSAFLQSNIVTQSTWPFHSYS